MLLHAGLQLLVCVCAQLEDTMHGCAEGPHVDLFRYCHCEHLPARRCHDVRLLYDDIKPVSPETQATSRHFQKYQK